MDEGRGIFLWGADQHRGYTVGTGHLQSLISGEEKLEEQAAKGATVTDCTDRARARALIVPESFLHYQLPGMRMLREAYGKE